MLPGATVEQTIAHLRALPADALVTYCYVCDSAGTLQGVVTMRDLLFAERNATLESMMLRNAFSLATDQDLTTALRATMGRHYPVYPVCDAQGKLVGLVRGQTIFEPRPSKSRRRSVASLAWKRRTHLHTHVESFRFRHPWLQLNLLTAF